jgi:hypothetical protein
MLPAQQKGVSMRIQRILVLTALSLLPGLLLGNAARAAVDIGVSVNIAPPELPVYEQPPVPGPDYLWAPGYWAWGDGDYYWVPGTWVQAPEPGYLWTPGYWGWADGVYLWHGGYWGPHVGFYGGVDYGYGYSGHGYEGGEWRGGRFFYNRSVNNIPGNAHFNVYNHTVVNNITVRRVSFNGGHGGIVAQETSAQRAEANERHLPPVGDQQHHQQAARENPQLRAASNHGAPPIAATAHAASFNGPGVTGARGAASEHSGGMIEQQVHAAQTNQGAGAVHAPVHQTNVPGPSHPAQTVAPHPGPNPGAAEHAVAQPAAHAIRPLPPGGGAGPVAPTHGAAPGTRHGAAPGGPREEHKGPAEHPAQTHSGPEHGGNPEHER